LTATETEAYRISVHLNAFNYTGEGREGTVEMNSETNHKPTKTAKGEQTRALILDTALDLLEERGYEKTTMREIAKKAGVSLGNALPLFRHERALDSGVLSSHARGTFGGDRAGPGETFGYEEPASWQFCG
jgi:hypothetical protein